MEQDENMFCLRCNTESIHSDSLFLYKEMGFCCRAYSKIDRKVIGEAAIKEASLNVSHII